MILTGKAKHYHRYEFCLSLEQDREEIVVDVLLDDEAPIHEFLEFSKCVTKYNGHIYVGERVS
jgi:hypothetical protein